MDGVHDHYMMIKCLIHDEDITILNLYEGLPWWFGR